MTDREKLHIDDEGQARWLPLRGFSSLFDNPSTLILPPGADRTNNEFEVGEVREDLEANPACELYRQLFETCERLFGAELGRSFAFVPQSSAHTTLLDGSNDGNLSEIRPEWLDAMTDFFDRLPGAVCEYEAIPGVDFLQRTRLRHPVSFRFQRLELRVEQRALVALLEPTEQNVMNEIIAIRGDLDTQWIRHFGKPAADAYQPHTTIGYFSSDADVASFASLIEDHNARVGEALKKIHITFSSFSTYAFQSMSSFIKPLRKVDIGRYFVRCERSFTPVDRVRAELAVAISLLIQQVDEIGAALTGAASPDPVDLLDDVGDALWALCNALRVVNPEESDLLITQSVAQRTKNTEFGLGELRRTAIEFCSAVQQFSYHVLVRGLQPQDLVSPPDSHVFWPFMDQLNALLIDRGLTLEDALRRNVEKVAPLTPNLTLVAFQNNVPQQLADLIAMVQNAAAQIGGLTIASPSQMHATIQGLEVDLLDNRLVGHWLSKTWEEDAIVDVDALYGALCALEHRTLSVQFAGFEDLCSCTAEQLADKECSTDPGSRHAFDGSKFSSSCYNTSEGAVMLTGWSVDDGILAKTRRSFELAGLFHKFHFPEGHKFAKRDDDDLSIKVGVLDMESPASHIANVMDEIRQALAKKEAFVVDIQIKDLSLVLYEDESLRPERIVRSEPLSKVIRDKALLRGLLDELIELKRIHSSIISSDGLFFTR